MLRERKQCAKTLRDESVFQELRRDGVDLNNIVVGQETRVGPGSLVYTRYGNHWENQARLRCSHICILGKKTLAA